MDILEAANADHVYSGVSSVGYELVPGMVCTFKARYNFVGSGSTKYLVDVANCTVKGEKNSPGKIVHCFVWCFQLRRHVKLNLTNVISRELVKWMEMESAKSTIVQRDLKDTGATVSL